MQEIIVTVVKKVAIDLVVKAVVKIITKK